MPRNLAYRGDPLYTRLLPPAWPPPSMFGQRGKIDIDSLLKIVLVLLIVILALRLVGYFVDVFIGVAGDVIVLILVVLLLLYLLDEL
jgi:hypothetical protein